MAIATRTKIETPHVRGEANPDLTINLKFITSEQVAELVKTYPHFFRFKVLPAIIDGVFDGAEAVVWQEGEGKGDLAISLVEQFDQRQRVRRWMAYD